MIKKEFTLNALEKKVCIDLARKSIKYYFENSSILTLNKKDFDKLPKPLLENKACFVTLTINNQLRGCVGHLNAIQPLYEDILENACSAAFSDTRFSALSEEDYSKIKIEVSILTEPFDFEFKSSNELINSLVKGKDGLIIRKGYHSATFLPSVWEEIDSKEEFLSHLCLKAGLAPDEWKNLGLKVQKYYAIKAKEV